MATFWRIKGAAMKTVRKATARGHANHGWLDSHFTFSFADYYDPKHMGFRALRVINDDRIEGGRGFGAHPHRDMEIITYLLDGAIAHKDSMGTGATVRPGEVQRMTAGTGVTHSEFNPSRTEETHLLQIWITPDKQGLPPSYEQKAFPDVEKRGKLRLVASPDGRDGSVTIHANVQVYSGIFGEGQTAELPIAPGRHAWVHVARGVVRVAGEELGEGDGLALSDEGLLRIEGIDEGELLVFDLA
jgi:redox-sensitive bicupin YhaK (pirin superfamily)